MCVLSKKLAPDLKRDVQFYLYKGGVTPTGRAVEDPNGGASFLASLRQPTPPLRLGPAQAGFRAWFPGGYFPG